MSWRRFLRLGAAELRALTERGELDAEAVRLALRGAAAYTGALLAGDIADDAEAERRAQGGCAHCPSAMTADQRLAETAAAPAACGVYCGEPFRDNSDDPERPTCGCLVGEVRINGEAVEILPAGKALVKSETCPQRRWG